METGLYLQRVVVQLAHDSERAVLGVVPATASSVQVEPHLVAAVESQLTEQVIAEPVVATAVIESDFKLRPRSVEEV